MYDHLLFLLMSSTSLIAVTEIDGFVLQNVLVYTFTKHCLFLYQRIGC
jgi:hypothetical protein